MNLVCKIISDYISIKMKINITKGIENEKKTNISR